MPMAPRVEEGKIPLRDIKPVDGLRAYRAVNEAGQLMEPCVALPIANGAKPAATAAAEPPDEPHVCFGTD